MPNPIVSRRVVLSPIAGGGVPAGYGALHIGASPSAPLLRIGSPANSFRILIPRAA